MPGILLLDLGTPDDPTPPSARRSLRELLSDRRVIDIPRVARRLPKGRGGRARGEQGAGDEGGRMPLRFAAAAGLVAALCALLPARAWG